MRVNATLCFIMKNNKVILLKKTKGLFGGGKWNAPGGKIKENESSEEGTVREVFEETGLKVKNLEKIGTLNFFKNGQKRKSEWIVDVFLTNEFKGRLKASREGKLKWFNANQLPFDKMWEDDTYWYKYILQKRRFEGNFYFLGDFEKLTEHEIKVF